MMKPYYEDTKAGIVIYCGDCREILPQLPKVDLVLTDPPFGIGNFVQTTGNIRGKRVLWNEAPPGPEVFQLFKQISKHRVIWGANYFNCFEGCGALIWNKNQPMPDFSKAEIASTSWGTKVEMLTLTWTNYVNSKVTNHPCERPVGLYTWSIGQVPEVPRTVLDPYCGSGSSLVACKELGISAVGIDIDEASCESSVKRLAQEVLAL